MWMGDRPFCPQPQRQETFRTCRESATLIKQVTTSSMPQRKPCGLKSTHLGLGLDGSTVFQQDLDDPNVTVPSCTVERSQFILRRRERLKLGPTGAETGRRAAERYATLVLASICAPLSSSSLTIITLPLLEAMCRGVMPFCRSRKWTCVT